MKLKEYINEYVELPQGVSATDCCALSIATDGLKLERDQIIAVCGEYNEEDVDPFCVYIEGGDPDKTKDFTGISSEIHHMFAVSKEEGWGEIMTALKGRYGIAHNYVSFSAKFVSKLLLDACPKDVPVERIPIADSLLIFRAIYQEYVFPKKKKPLYELCAEIGYRLPRSGVSEALPAVFSRYFNKSASDVFRGEQPFVVKAKMLISVWKALLEEKIMI